MCHVDIHCTSTFKIFSMPGFIIFPIDLDIPSTSRAPGLLYNNNIVTLYFRRWQHLRDGGCWMTAACRRLKIYENGGSSDHWRQIQIEANRNTTKHCLDASSCCIGLGGEGLLWGGWRVIKSGGGGPRGLDLGTSELVIAQLHIHA
jgi:hypothetical protein